MRHAGSVSSGPGHDNAKPQATTRGANRNGDMRTSALLAVSCPSETFATNHPAPAMATHVRKTATIKGDPVI